MSNLHPLLRGSLHTLRTVALFVGVGLLAGWLLGCSPSDYDVRACEHMCQLHDGAAYVENPGFGWMGCTCIDGSEFVMQAGARVPGIEVKPCEGAE